jgi:hypothetical protein
VTVASRAECRRIVARALMAATGAGPSVAQAAARDFITGPGPAFTVLCVRAGLDPDTVRTVVYQRAPPRA